MKGKTLLLVGLIFAATFAWAAEGGEGELRVILLLTQRTGPEQLNKIVGDIGSGAPTLETWGRKTTFVKKLRADNYTITVKNVETCAFEKCVPCPEQSRDIVVTAAKQVDVTFRWRAHFDRQEKKWVCEE